MKLVSRPGPRDGYYEIDASAAQKILDKKTKNRPLMESSARRLARSIDRGEWVTNGESVIFDASGNLMDGQHRMRAIVLANRPIVTYCVFLQRSREAAFDTIDLGSIRKVSDMIALDGHSLYRQCAAVARLLHAYEFMVSNEASGLSCATGGNQGAAPSSTAMKRFYEQNQVEIDAATAFVSPFKKQLTGFIPESIVGFATLMARRYDPVKAGRFIEAVVTGENLSKTSPIWLLRTQILQAGRKELGPSYKLALLIKTWNAYAAGLQIKTLKFSSNESFPRFIAMGAE